MAAAAPDGGGWTRVVMKKKKKEKNVDKKTTRAQQVQKAKEQTTKGKAKEDPCKGHDSRNCYQTGTTPEGKRIIYHYISDEENWSIAGCSHYGYTTVED